MRKVAHEGNIRPSTSIDISIVIPVYRSESSLLELYKRLKETLSEISINFEILLIEDCGGDHSWDLIASLCEQDIRVRGLRMSRNYGQHNALLAGIRAAQGNFIVTIDDDLQHPPEEIPKMISKIKEGYDVVYGSPEEEQHGILRNVASQITKLALQNAMGASTARNVSAFRIFRTHLRDAFWEYRSPSVNIDVLLTWGTTQFASIHVKHNKRKYGQSGYTTRKLITHAMNMMTGFSTIPLKFASVIGFLLSIFGFCVLVDVVLRYCIWGGTVKGFTFLSSIIALMSGGQLLAIGIIGEYLSRIYLRTMERPVYIISEIIGGSIESNRVL